MEQEVEVQDIVCQSCGHIIRSTPNLIEQYRKEFEAGTKTCEVCVNQENGIKRVFKRLWSCSECKQVQLDKQSGLCFCKVKSQLTVVTDPHNKWTNHLDKTAQDEINMGKTQRMFRDRVQKERERTRNVVDENNILLTEIRDLMKEEKKKDAV